MNHYKNNRYVILAAASMAGLMVGACLTWSIFKNPLMERNNWNSNAVTLAYSLYMLFSCVGTFLCAPLQRYIRPTILLMIAGCMHGFGFFFTGNVKTIAQLYLSYSLLAGLGNGLIYNTAIATATKWFPDKKGFSNGICIGCMGLASLLFAPLGNTLISNYDVSVAFQIIGILMITVFLIISFFIKAPEDGWSPKGFIPNDNINISRLNLSWQQLLRTPAFYSMWFMTLCSVTAGAMMIGQASAIAQHMTNISPSQASLQVALLAVANFCGRLAFGSFSDKVGRFRIQLILLTVSAIDMLFFFNQVNTFFSFTVALCIIGACYGGIMAMLPPMVSDAFGLKSFGTNYACMYSAYTCASFVGPMVASEVLQQTGTYNYAFLIIGTLSIFGICATLLTQKLILNTD